MTTPEEIQAYTRESYARHMAPFNPATNIIIDEDQEIFDNTAIRNALQVLRYNPAFTGLPPQQQLNTLTQMFPDAGQMRAVVRDNAVVGFQRHNWRTDEIIEYDTAGNVGEEGEVISRSGGPLSILTAVGRTLRPTMPYLLGGVALATMSPYLFSMSGPPPPGILPSPTIRGESKMLQQYSFDIPREEITPDIIVGPFRRQYAFAGQNVTEIDEPRAADPQFTERLLPTIEEERRKRQEAEEQQRRFEAEAGRAPLYYGPPELPPIEQQKRFEAGRVPLDYGPPEPPLYYGPITPEEAAANAGLNSDNVNNWSANANYINDLQNLKQQKMMFDNSGDYEETSRRIKEQVLNEPYPNFTGVAIRGLMPLQGEPIIWGI